MTRSMKNGSPFGDDENYKTNKCSFCGAEDDGDDVCAQGYRICPSCAEQMDLYDIMDLFGFDNVAELIEALDR